MLSPAAGMKPALGGGSLASLWALLFVAAVLAVWPTSGESEYLPAARGTFPRTGCALLAKIRGVVATAPPLYPPPPPRGSGGVGRRGARRGGSGW